MFRLRLHFCPGKQVAYELDRNTSLVRHILAYDLKRHHVRITDTQVRVSRKCRNFFATHATNMLF